MKNESDILYAAYGLGAFPMAENGSDEAEIEWYCPEQRAVFLPNRFHVPRRLRRWIRGCGLAVRWNDDFEAVMRACGEQRDETWINAPLVEAYGALAQQGKAFCLSVWRGDQRVGGLYGVHMGGVFMAESMFSREPNASSVALTVFMDGAARCGIELVDVQFLNDHLMKFHPVLLPHEDYMARLSMLKHKDVRMDAQMFYLDAALGGVSVQSFNQTS